MPVCQGHHWTLIAVEPRKRTISHFDSLNPSGSDEKRFLTKEWIKAVLGDAYVEEDWQFVKHAAPRQTNGWDCGVHTVLNGLCLGLGIDPSTAYGSEELPELRKQLAAMLLNGGFKGEFDLAGC
jgi:sentrin-specific protease 1